MHTYLLLSLLKQSDVVLLKHDSLLRLHGCWWWHHCCCLCWGDCWWCCCCCSICRLHGMVCAPGQLVACACRTGLVCRTRSLFLLEAIQLAHLCISCHQNLSQDRQYRPYFSMILHLSQTTQPQHTVCGMSALCQQRPHMATCSVSAAMQCWLV